jgi:mannitol/fructose-specific phosphotransferase system IIA component (Ntr-type)
MVEHGQQSPPTAERILQIEQVLDVPAGYLLSVTRGFDSDLALFIEEVPEVADFLRMAKEKGMEAEDFMELTGLLNAYGLKGLRGAIKSNTPQADKFAINAPVVETKGPYLWPFLRKKLIFDVAGIKKKPSFLKEAVARIADRAKGLDPDAILKDLIDREKTASTGIGHGVAVPHAYTTGLDDMILALFRIPEGLGFDAIDGQPVYLVFVLAGPRSSGQLHLKLLARIARLFSHNSFYEKILGAPNPREIISIFKAAEMKIP